MFEMKLSWGLRALMWITQIVLIVWYRNTPMFYVPREWLGPITGILRFPFSPTGMYTRHWICTHRIGWIHFCNLAISIITIFHGRYTFAILQYPFESFLY